MVLLKWQFFSKFSKVGPIYEICSVVTSFRTPSTVRSVTKTLKCPEFLNELKRIFLCLVNCVISDKEEFS